MPFSVLYASESCDPSKGICNPIPSVAGVPDLIKLILTGALKIGIPLVALAVIYCGFLFVFARGNSEKLTKAKDALLYTLIGAAILLGSGRLRRWSRRRSLVLGRKIYEKFIEIRFCVFFLIFVSVYCFCSWKRKYYSTILFQRSRFGWHYLYDSATFELQYLSFDSAGGGLFCLGNCSYVIGDSEEAKKKGRDRIIYGIIGLAVIVSLWGLVNVVVKTFNLSGAAAPTLTPLTGPAAIAICPALRKFRISCVISLALLMIRLFLLFSL